MGLGVGIVGLPNIGKSTTFNALTKAKMQKLKIIHFVQLNQIRRLCQFLIKD